ncbi:MATE family efflux transporter [Bryobacter aggregatus]|uniref:MATE family efflux transporter n=1 Tax=Bryobacter aggregatus TaxID=360054 RepID=UPI000568AC2C|nr:MATE family efflux transporter [Bryobacter aggregatus]
MSIHPIRGELRLLSKLAIPVILAELGWMLMGVVDTIMVGRLGAEAIGAVAIGNILFHTVGLIAIGMLLGLDTLISQAYGAGDLDDANHSLRQGLWLAAFCAPVLLVAMWLLVPLMRLWGIDARVMDLAEPFTYVLALSVFPISFYTAQRRYLQSLHIVRPITAALLSANLINLVLNWVLIYGHLGFPQLGVTGSAWATVGARIYLALFLFVVLWLRERRADTGLLRWEWPEWARLRQLVVLGAPAAGHIFLEIAVFGAATVLAGRFPPVALAAHEVTLNHAALAYMVPLGISSAAAVRVGNEVGAGNGSGARLAGNTALALGALFMSLSAVFMFTVPRFILGIYTVDRGVIEYAVPLLFWAAAFQLFDGVQVVATGALRGKGDTHAPFLAGIVGYWVLGLPLGAWLCFGAGFGVAGLWIGLSAGLAIVAGLLLVRWLKLT